MIEIILIFLYVGLFTIGGGMIAIPLIQQQVVQRGMITFDEFVAMIAIAESTPGPIGINIATYVGFSQYHIIGAILATTAFVLPSFVIVTLLAGLLKKYKNTLLVIYWFYYLKAVIIGLILYATMNIFTHTIFKETEPVLKIDFKVVVLFFILAPIYYIFRKKPWISIVAGALLGILIFRFF